MSVDDDESGIGAAAEALLRLIGLIAADTSDERLAAPARDLKRSRASAAAVAAVEEATEAARRITRTLAQRRRREAELAALFDTAGDLAALRNLDSVLRAIVHRARTLLGADLSYIALQDPEAGDTYMRVTDGSVSAAFQRLRLGMGEGLGGLVAETALPYASTDYRVDPRFRHTERIDSAVAEEGVHGIVGVPLRVGEQVIGVLFAADRAPRGFAPDDIAMLVSLANHAAVAIESVRQLEGSAQTLRELSEAARTSERLNRALRRAADAHDRLTGLVLSGGDVADLASQTAELFAGPIGIYDAEGGELARAGDGEVRFVAEGVEGSQAGRGAVLADGLWVCAVMAGPEPLGSIVLGGRTGLGEADRQLFERTALVTALLLLLRRSVADAEDRVRGELLDDLLTDAGRRRSGGSSLRLRARRLGIDLHRPHAVFVLDCDAQPRLASEANRHARAEGGLAGGRDGRPVLLLPATDPGAQAAKLAAAIGRSVGQPATVGASAPVDDPERLPEAYAEAVRCTEAMLTLGRRGEGACMEQLGFIGVLLGESGTDAFVQRTIGPVLDYDRRRGTDLVGTLEAYYAAGGHLAKTKAALNVHVNTVSQRLDRVAAILGRDWNAPARSLEVQLALRVHRLSRAGR
ncbi:helix-turn-helix domain-containing protein [Glycomyces terrestris]|uniref:helix-turn-helix domain-containing protein n=1 Tax=Glycomyces terrestris TaxID=2493553 RepID=UPI001652358B|nr:GAF domain-containing protein [Glycomyces terrestris]